MTSVGKQFSVLENKTLEGMQICEKSAEQIQSNTKIQVFLYMLKIYE